MTCDYSEGIIIIVRPIENFLDFNFNMDFYFVLIKW